MSTISHRPVVVITGATAGVGRATTRLFAERGASIALLARGRNGLEATVREVEAAGSAALAVPTDVSDPEQVEAAATRTEETFGPIDIWVNNAMATIFAPVVEIRPEEMRRVTDVTYHGFVWGTMAALRRMRPRDHGTIVQVGSALAYRGIPLQSAYCASKHAIRGFTDSLRAELIDEGSSIRLTMVQLPGLNTPQFSWNRTRMKRQPQPVPPIFEPEVAARAILWAADHAPRELEVGRSTVQVIWGNKVAPSLGDLYLGRTGVESQQADQEIDPDRPDNLFSPVEGDFGARGAFSDRATDTSPQLWARTHPLLLVAGGLLVAAGIGAAVGAVRRDP